MLKVLQLIPTLDRSGAEKQMVLLATGLPRDRFRVEVAALTRLGPLEAELRAAGVPVTAIGKRFKLDPLALARLVRFLRPGGSTWSRPGSSRPTRTAGWRHGWRGCRWWSRPRWPSTSGRVGASWRSTAGWRRGTDRVVGNSQAVVDFYRRLGVPADGWR